MNSVIDLLGKEGRITHVVRWTTGRYAAAAEIWEAAVTGDGEVEVCDQDDDFTIRPVEEAQTPLVRVWLRADGEAHINFSPSGDAYYIAGQRDLDNLFGALSMVYARAKTHIDNWHGKG